MTELNQRVSAITRRVVEQGETIRVTNRGRVVLRLIPEPSGEHSLDALIASGEATPPTGRHRRRSGRTPVRLSADLDELLEESRSDRGL